MRITTEGSKILKMRNIFMRSAAAERNASRIYPQNNLLYFHVSFGRHVSESLPCNPFVMDLPLAFSTLHL